MYIACFPPNSSIALLLSAADPERAQQGSFKPPFFTARSSTLTSLTASQVKASRLLLLKKGSVVRTNFELLLLRSHPIIFVSLEYTKF